MNVCTVKLCSATSSGAHVSSLATLTESDVDELVLLIKMIFILFSHQFHAWCYSAINWLHWYLQVLMRGFCWWFCFNALVAIYHRSRRHQKMLLINGRQKRAVSASPKENVLLKGSYLKTTFVCKLCPSEPGLHPESCFKKYHTKISMYIKLNF